MLGTLLVLIGAAIAGLAWALTRQRFSFWAQHPDDYTEEGRTFDLREALNGPMTAEGVIYDYTGRVNARFTVDIDVTWTAETGRMTERFHYDHGGTMERYWDLALGEGGRFTATAPDVEGTAKGCLTGGSCRLEYRLRLAKSAGGHVLHVVDWMYLMRNGAIVNRSQMRKWGIKVAEIVATFRKCEAAHVDQ